VKDHTRVPTPVTREEGVSPHHKDEVAEENVGTNKEIKHFEDEMSRSAPKDRRV